MRCLPGGDESENDTGGERDEQGETEDRGVELNRADARNVLRDGLDQSFGSPLREKQPEPAAQTGEEHALGQELPDDAHAAGAHRGAQRDFLSASRGAREQKVRDVGVRNQQHADDRAEQDIQGGADVADHVFPQRPGSHAKKRVRLRILFRQTGGDGRQISLRLRDRDARFQSRDGFEAVTAALLGLGLRAVRVGRVLRDRHVEIDRVSLDGELKTGGHHTDHGVRAPVERHRFAEHVWITAKMFLPEIVADDDLETAGSAAALFIIARQTCAQSEA